MVNRQTPPGRTSISRVVVVNPRGPHQWATCVGSVHTANRSSRGALNTREVTISRSDAGSGLLGTVLLLLLKFAEVFVQPVETLFPEPLKPLDPVMHRPEAG